MSSGKLLLSLLSPLKVCRSPVKSSTHVHPLSHQSPVLGGGWLRSYLPCQGFRQAYAQMLLRRQNQHWITVRNPETGPGGQAEPGSLYAGDNVLLESGLLAGERGGAHCFDFPSSSAVIYLCVCRLYEKGYSLRHPEKTTSTSQSPHFRRCRGPESRAQDGWCFPVMTVSPSIRNTQCQFVARVSTCEGNYKRHQVSSYVLWNKSNLRHCSAALDWTERGCVGMGEEIPWVRRREEDTEKRRRRMVTRQQLEVAVSLKFPSWDFFGRNTGSGAQWRSMASWHARTGHLPCVYVCVFTSACARHVNLMDASYWCGLYVSRLQRIAVIDRSVIDLLARRVSQFKHLAGVAASDGVMMAYAEAH